MGTKNRKDSFSKHNYYMKLSPLINTNQPMHLQAHCQSPTSQRLYQSFVKELAKPMH
jgi:hypothetical protein